MFEYQIGALLKPLLEPSVLLIEDDDVFAEEIVEYLGTHGLRVSRCATLDALMETLSNLGPQLVVLDQFVGDQDSLTVLAELRRSYRGGVVILTGNDEHVDRVIGLELGADDFVSKSQPPREILARLRAVLRRAAAATDDTVQAESAPAPPAETAKPAPAWTFDTRRRELLAPTGARVTLTAMEFELLAYLHGREGDVVSRDELSEAILRRRFSPLDRSLDNLVARIRAALKPFEGDRNIIKSVRGAGYVFVGFGSGD